MTDKELLELAAKAAGLNWKDWTKTIFCSETELRDWPYDWNPLADDGDALRLAVTLRLQITHYPIYGLPKHSVIAGRWALADDNVLDAYAREPHGNDPLAATRRAITRAAAEIGRTM